MGVTQTTMWLPEDLWKAVQLHAKGEGGVNALILRALEDYLSSLHRTRGRRRPGKYTKQVVGLSRPVADLQLSARPAASLRLLGVRHMYELVPKTSAGLRMMRNFGEKLLRGVQARVAALGLRLGMTLDRPSYAAAVTAALIENLRAAKS